MKLKKLLRKIIISAAAVCMAAAMTVTSFAADPGTVGTITVPGSVVTPGQVYNPAKEKEDRTGTRYKPGKQTSTLSPEETTIIHFVLANKTMASGTMNDVKAAKNSSFELPDYEFKAQKGYTFEHYVGFDGREFQPGESIGLGDADEYWIWACFKPGDDIAVVNFHYYLDEISGGKMESVEVKKGSKYKLLECTFWYVRMRYVVDGMEGEWSRVATVKV